MKSFILDVCVWGAGGLKSKVLYRRQLPIMPKGLKDNEEKMFFLVIDVFIILIFYFLTSIIKEAVT